MSNERTCEGSGHNDRYLRLFCVLILAIREVDTAKKKYFNHSFQRQPASTWVGVTALVSRRYLVEVEAIAVVAAGKSNL